MPKATQKTKEEEKVAYSAKPFYYPVKRVIGKDIQHISDALSLVKPTDCTACKHFDEYYGYCKEGWEAPRSGACFFYTRRVRSHGSKAAT